MITSRKIDTNSGTIVLLTITNASGASVTLSTVGAGILAARVPDRTGHIDDVVLGYADPADYISDGPCAGKIPGRYANRIARGRFTIDGHEHTLAVNNGPNALHGGPTGFHNRLWALISADDDKVVMEYTSADGEEGYPGCLKVTATYTWSDDCVLRLDMRATTDRKTVVNLTNHTYFNLSGHSSGSVLRHRLLLNASRYLPTDDTLIPVGNPASVEGTPMDFRTAKALGTHIHADFPAIRYGKGYDNCWAIDGHIRGVQALAAVLTEDSSGRRLTVETTQPGVQIYTGNWLDGSPAGKDGAIYHDYDGVAIECQAFPDSPNRPDFPSTLLCPGEEYAQSIIFKFDTF